MISIALAAGHHNRDSGNEYEIETTGLLTPRLAAACRRLGMDVWVAQPEDGAGHVPGGIWDVGRAVAARRPPPDVFLEVHTEGVADPEVRGVFAIYPDSPPESDLDVDVRDTLGPRLAALISSVGGIPRREVPGEAKPGVMSERRTGVGREGYRLGIFASTVALRVATTRLLIEYGAHSNPVERRLHRNREWLEAVADATARGLLEWAKELAGALQPAPLDPPPPPPPAGGSAGELTVASPLRRPASATSVQALRYLLRTGGTRWYPEAVLWTLVEAYWTYAGLFGLDPVLVLAQAVVETRREGRPFATEPASWRLNNFAGIGITGQERAARPPEGSWYFEPDKGVWRAITPFATMTDGVIGHVGRLVRYCYPVDEPLSTTQRGLVDRALAARPLDARYWGVAPDPRGLRATWAVPGDGYPEAIVAVANAILAERGG